MDKYRIRVAATLGAIVTLGLFSTQLIISMRVPQFLIYTSYIAAATFLLLIPLSLRGISWAFAANIILALTVMVANASISQHMAILLSSDFLHASILLLVGAYVLQPILLVTSVQALRRKG